MKIGSLFAGIGGIDLAFRQAGFQIAFANEIDEDACKTYRLNFPQEMLIQGDVRSIDPSVLPPIDVLTAGFPCQPFSVCGNQKGFSDKRGNLFFEIMRIADATKPSVIFLENVANLVNHDNGKTLLTLYNELASRGYILRYMVADACNYGIPQHRTRTYIVAFVDECSANIFSFPQTSKEQKRISDVLDRKVKADCGVYLAVESKDYQMLERYICDDGQLYRFSDYGIQSSKSGVSFTLKANMGTWYKRIPYFKDNYGIRIISPEECLLLMGFPKAFRFPNTISAKAKYKQCGNSVAVPLVAQIAVKIKEAIAEK